MFKKFLIIMIRYVVSLAGVTISTMICFFYIMFYLFGAMKFASIKNNIIGTIKEMNKTLIDEKEGENSFFNKVIVHIYNSIVNITCIFIILAALLNANKIINTPVHKSYIIVNIILLFILLLFIFKEAKKTFFPDIVGGSAAPSAPSAPAAAPSAPAAAPSASAPAAAPSAPAAAPSAPSVAGVSPGLLSPQIPSAPPSILSGLSKAVSSGISSSLSGLFTPQNPSAPPALATGK
jgi:hypothetical protein